VAFNQLTDAQAERLYILSEELGETQQAIGKILRHGYESGWNGSNNRSDLEKEIGHVYNSVNRLLIASDLNMDGIVNSGHLKQKSILPFLHHQNEG